MYYCNNCDTSFEEKKDTCPFCGSDDVEEMKQCEMCEEYFKEDDLHDTEEYINGGCGYCCEQCIEDGDMVEI